MGLFTFRKEERLYKRKQIQELFERGSTFYLYPFKVYYLEQPLSPLHQILMSVSTRQFKRAVDRNRIKRRMREAYRLQKDKMPEKKIAVAFIYTAKEILSFSDIRQKMLLSFTKIKKLMDSSNDAIGHSK